MHSNTVGFGGTTQQDLTPSKKKSSGIKSSIGKLFGKKTEKGKAAAVMAQAHLTAHGHGGHVGAGAQRADLLPHEALQLLPGGLPPSAGARLPPDGAIMHK